ncbi:Calcium-transporting ATPase 10, plasma membrane-type, partial [Irineochytrium annulatum]
ANATAPDITRKIEEMRAKMQGTPEGGYGVDPDVLGELCNFDKRTNPSQVGILEGEYGGVEGVALLLRSDIVRGVKLWNDPGVEEDGSGGSGSAGSGGSGGAAQKVAPASRFDMTAADSLRRQAVYGVNKIPPPKSETIFGIVWNTIVEDPIIKVLLVGAVTVLVLGTVLCPSDGWIEGLVIMIAVVIVLSVTAGNDYLKDLKFKKLLLMQSDKRVKVIRSGMKDEISSWDIMVGDVVEVVTGDEIPADGIYISGNRLVIDESPLTGESVPVKKSSQAPFLFSGCQVSEGSGKVLITGVGVRSSGGQIQELLNEAQNEETVLQHKLKIVAVLIGKIGVAAGIATFLGLAIRWSIDWAQGRIGVNTSCQGTSTNDTIARIQLIAQDFVVGITVVVVAVPEGLPLAVTISLAFSMFKMIKDKCFVRHLDASEVMGEATCICTDKTGTLTENKMTVVKTLLGDKLYYGDGSGEVNSAPFTRDTFEIGIRDIMIEGMCLNSDCFIKIHEENGTDMFIGSATEGAMLVLSRTLGYEYEHMRTSVAKVEGGIWSFSSERKRMSTLIVPHAATPTKKRYRLHSKGASEIILSLCTHMLDSTGTKIMPLTATISTRIQRIIQRWASEGLRTIGMAFRDTDQMITTLETGQGDDPEHDLVWVGLIGIKDPLRKEVPGAVATCQRAGLTVRMVTGDNILTACKISRECGILFGDGVALEGPVFRAMSTEEKMAVIPKLAVLARSSPGDKHTLVCLLKEMGEVVAVTGDGTNDAPALKEADVGFAMGISGTQIARNASDIILLDDNFVSLVQSIRWGRNVLNCVRKFLQFQLGVNLVAIVITFVGSVTVGTSPLNTVQLLWVNLIMDSLGALGLASDDPEDDILEHPPHARSESLLSTHMLVYIGSQLSYQLVVLMVLLLKMDSFYPAQLHVAGRSASDIAIPANGEPSTRIKTIVFTTFILLQVTNEIMARQLNGELNVFKNFLRNKLFLGILGIIIVVQIIGVLVGGSFLGTCPMDWVEWVICICCSLGNLLFVVFVRLGVKIFAPKASKGSTESLARGVGGVDGEKEKAIASNPQSDETIKKTSEIKSASDGSPAPNGPRGGPVSAWSNETLETPPIAVASENAAGTAVVQSPKPKSKWTTVQSAVVLIGSYREVKKVDYQGKGPDDEFMKTWMRFRKDAALPTKGGSMRASQTLKKL